MLKTAVFEINGMHCTSCALTIDMDLEETEGVKESNTSYARQKTEVTFDSDIIKPEKIIEIIQKTGYEASETD
ncbi:heavy-metal-associated domain-containing protein [Candidatus Gottesmanbacteria bacterium]|nr:heavy-metal-associated domain-containing protein [Candidatus Gottesmanbacteria bacterium]MBI5451949.1 heavy-metal-associated domain-containing protein [Candidatus Gottesmanbacteria bacterium]